MSGKNASNLLSAHPAPPCALLAPVCPAQDAVAATTRPLSVQGTRGDIPVTQSVAGCRATGLDCTDRYAAGSADAHEFYHVAVSLELHDDNVLQKPTGLGCMIHSRILPAVGCISGIP